MRYIRIYIIIIIIISKLTVARSRRPSQLGCQHEGTWKSLQQNTTVKRQEESLTSKTPTFQLYKIDFSTESDKG